MKKRVLIVVADQPKNEVRMKGPEKDAHLMRKYLMSPLGGAWEDDEILTLQNPTRELFCKWRCTFQQDCDYTLSVFSGSASTSPAGRYVYLHFADGKIKYNILGSTAPRQTWILDVGKGQSRPKAEKLTSPGIWNLNHHVPLETIRSRYEEAILEGSEGLNLLMSEYPQYNRGSETHEGSGYLVALLKQAEQFALMKTRKDVLYTRKAHEGAVEFLREKLGSEQRPITCRQKVYFPLAVKV